MKHKRECVYNANSQIINKHADTLLTPTILNAQSDRQLPYVVKSDDKAYIRHLEDRIQYLESRLSVGGDDLGAPPKDGETENEDTTRFYRPSSKWRFAARSHILLVQEFCQNLYNSLDESNQQKISLPRHQFFGWNMSGTHYLSTDPLPELPNIALPEPLEVYTEYFFEHINPLFAIIHHSVFRQQMSAYKATITSVSGGAKTPQHVKLFEAMLYLTVAISIRFREFEKKDLSLPLLAIEEQLFKFCHSIISTLSFQWESLELVQCWMLIAFYLRTTHRQSSYYYAMGQAATLAKSTGLTKNRNVVLIGGTPYEELKATRIFWSLFSMERLFGIQSGRFLLLEDSTMEFTYPSIDFKTASVHDTWITLPALAMIHIARLSGFIRSAVKPDILKYQHINKELIEMNKWLNDNGFNTTDLFNDPADYSSSMIKAQVKLHYYDLVLAIHGRVLFNFVGRRIATPGLKIELVLDACSNILEVLEKVHQARRLYSPWYLTLLLLFTVGIDLLVLINSGLHTTIARKNYAQSLELIGVLKKANVVSPDRRVIIKKRFKMAAECLWALNTCSKAMGLRFQQELEAFSVIDPGPPDVNRATFSRYGFMKEETGGDLDELQEIGRTGKRRRVNPHMRHAPNPTADQSLPQPPGFHAPLDPDLDPGTRGTDTNSSTSFNEFNPNDPSFMNTDSGLYSNLLWFDQWFDNVFPNGNGLGMPEVPDV